MARLKVGVLVSGRGSNLQALIEATRAADHPAELVVVISNQPEAPALARAAAAGIAAVAVPHRGQPSREAFEALLNQALAKAGVELICLAGFLRLFTPGFVERWHGRMINIHPALLPAFRGLQVQEQALAAGVRLAGCTVHYVVPEMDAGPIIGQAAVPVRPDDTPDSLAARVLTAEHQLYPHCLRLVAEGRVRLEGDRVVVTAPTAEGLLINPAL